MAAPTKGTAGCGFMFTAWLGATSERESPIAAHRPRDRVRPGARPRVVAVATDVSASPDPSSDLLVATLLLPAPPARRERSGQHIRVWFVMQ